MLQRGNNSFSQSFHEDKFFARFEFTSANTFKGDKPHIYREYVYSVVVYQKYLTRLRELIIFEPWRENYHFSQLS